MPKTLPGMMFAAAVMVAGQAQADQELVAVRVDQAPSVDGVADDPAWSQATALVTRDPLANIDLTIKAVYTDGSICFLVTFPDQNENRAHKSMTWVPDEERYRTGGDREDTFVFKWSMEPGPVDLNVTADNAYKADIWFWKAHRTDHAGYADDKMHVYSPLEASGANMVLSKRGARFFLSRPGDGGRAAYETVVYETYAGDLMPKYRFLSPEGSRADVRAKGVWRDGVWTVEFERKLDTGHADDIQFDPRRSYRFGVSRFEIAGRRKNLRLEEPYFGAGDIGETLLLRFQNARLG